MECGGLYIRQEAEVTAFGCKQDNWNVVGIDVLFHF